MSKYWSTPPWMWMPPYMNPQQGPVTPLPSTQDEYLKFLKKEQKRLKRELAAKKPEDKKKEDEKKKQTFTLLQTISLCLITGLPVAILWKFLFKLADIVFKSL